jgi:hypothetical protein
MMQQKLIYGIPISYGISLHEWLFGDKHQAKQIAVHDALPSHGVKPT